MYALLNDTNKVKLIHKDSYKLPTEERGNFPSPAYLSEIEDSVGWDKFHGVDCPSETVDLLMSNGTAYLSEIEDCVSWDKFHGIDRPSKTVDLLMRVPNKCEILCLIYENTVVSVETRARKLQVLPVPNICPFSQLERKQEAGNTVEALNDFHGCTLGRGDGQAAHDLLDLVHVRGQYHQQGDHAPRVLSLEELAGRIADIDKRRAREILENAVQRIIELLTVEKPFAVSEKASIGQIDSTVELANENTETDSPIILVNELETSESTASNQEDIVAWEEPLTQDQDKIAAISDVAFSTTPNLRTAKPHGLVFTMVTRGSKQPKQKTGNQSDENMEPTILGPVRKRGRGRPKGTIPPPVVNDQGQNVYRCETLHMRRHSGQRPFTCDICGKAFTTKGNMQAHVACAHTDEKPWTCPTCGKAFKEKKTSLQRHEAMHIKAEYSCDLCGDTFTQPDDLHNHLLTVHTTVAQPLVCENCNFVFEDQSEWAEHRQLHENDSGALGGTPVPVEGGDTVYLTSGEGLLTSGGGDQVLLVEEGVGIGGGGYDALHSVLVSAAMSADTLGEGVHMRRHSGQRPFTCDICGKAFTTKGNMQAHVACAHTDEKPWTCPTCGKAFKEKKTSLQRHEAMHIKAEYSCDLCGDTFTQPDDLHNHLLTVHTTVAQPLVCENCNFVFEDQSEWAEHRQLHENDSGALGGTPVPVEGGDTVYLTSGEGLLTSGGGDQVLLVEEGVGIGGGGYDALHSVLVSAAMSADTLGEGDHMRQYQP
ncbi:ZN841-like protein [Mya arenaria]|uniref:ZN841-like protein n=1 Tax=Mya arenaria TaxID=6604 RepID=A0ABY7G6W7_MYAAR|nr:ZN841-like protein [Mya arenaria]